MRSSTVALVAAAVAALALPRVARADCSSAPECLLRLGVGRLDPHVGGAVAAGAFAAVAAGATVAAVTYREERPPLDGVDDTVDEKGRHHLSLRLVPVPPPATPATLAGPGTVSLAASEASFRRTGALQLDDGIATAAIAVGGAALLASVIAGFLHH